MKTKLFSVKLSRDYSKKSNFDREDKSLTIEDNSRFELSIKEIKPKEEYIALLNSQERELYKLSIKLNDIYKDFGLNNKLDEYTQAKNIELKNDNIEIIGYNNNIISRQEYEDFEDKEFHIKMIFGMKGQYLQKINTIGLERGKNPLQYYIEDYIELGEDNNFTEDELITLMDYLKPETQWDFRYMPE